MTLWKIISKASSYVFGRRRERIEWEREEVVQPLLEEIDAAANGDLPGQQGDRHSEWEDLDESTKDRMRQDQVATLDTYLRQLEHLNDLSERERRLGRQSIHNFPGGEMRNEEPVMATEVLQIQPHRVPEKTNVSDWVKNHWSLFEQSETASEFRTRLEAKATDSSTSFDEEVIRCWEHELDTPHWHRELWNIYTNGTLREFRDISEEMEETRESAVDLARESERKLRSMNQGGLLPP